MKNLLNQFAEYFEKNEEFQRELVDFQRAIKSKQWKFYGRLLMTIKGIMANDMFSRGYTNLSQEEKDVMQRTYYNIDQMLTFLLDPLAWIRKRSKWSNLTNLIRKEKK